MRFARVLNRPLSMLAVAAVLFIVSAAANAEEPPPPPRSVADITAILDQDKPKPEVLARIRAAVEADPPEGTQGAALANFYYDRAFARNQVGRIAEAMADAEKAIELGKGTVDLHRQMRFRTLHALLHRWAGQHRQGLALFKAIARELNQPGVKGLQFAVNRHISDMLIITGDLEQAETYVARSQALMGEARQWRSHPANGSNWQAHMLRAQANLLFAKGKFTEATAVFARAEERANDALKRRAQQNDPIPLEQQHHFSNSLVADQGESKARAGRLAEAETDVRRALIQHLQLNGKYNAWTAKLLRQLAQVLLEQGRYEEAEKLLRSALEIGSAVGFRRDARLTVGTTADLVAVLSFQRRWSEAAALYAELDGAIKAWPPLQRQTFELNADRIYLYYKMDQVDRGIAAANSLIERETARVGEQHFDTGVARGILAIGLTRANREEEALAQFQQAIPLLMAAPEERDYDDTAWVAARSSKLQLIVEAYLTLRARKDSGAGVAMETFPYADAVRSQAVHKAVAAAGARMIIGDPALAGLVRSEQDFEKEANAHLTLLNDLLTAAPDQRDQKVIGQTRQSVEKLRAARQNARNELLRRFPSYADLTHPKPPGIADVQSMLRPGEALLSIYAGQEAAFVWAVPQSGPPAFAMVPLGIHDIDSKAAHLRAALTPQASYIADIPPFDLAAAHELYRALLQPVEAGWRPAKTVFVVTNGTLGALPLSVLPVAPAVADQTIAPRFSAYRNVPWLARTHALVTLPSAAALRTLRSLPPGPASRAPLIGFGDPFFTAEQAVTAAAEPVSAPDPTRGMPLKLRALRDTTTVDSADLALLPRLPDTADELRAVAETLAADPAKALKLGKDANERTVKTASLSNYKVVAFATHGLVAGELNGLTQPALALTAPQVAGVDGDGLLTMEEVLALRLNADWVVLSACNTGTGIGAGAEAASGLGRAFFYAGSRALLVTNWPVHSISARELVTGIFRRQASNPALPRGEALRQSMMALLDNSGSMQNGEMQYSYGHPMFWAPYTLIGDGGTNAAAP